MTTSANDRSSEILDRRASEIRERLVEWTIRESATTISDLVADHVNDHAWLAHPRPEGHTVSPGLLDPALPTLLLTLPSRTVEADAAQRVSEATAALASLVTIETLHELNERLGFNLELEYRGSVLSPHEESLPPTPEVRAVVIVHDGAGIAPVGAGMARFTIDVRRAGDRGQEPAHSQDAFAHLVDLYRAFSGYAADRGPSYRSALFAGFPSVAPLGVSRVVAGEASHRESYAEFDGRLGILPGENISQVKSDVEAIVEGLDALDSWPIPSMITWHEHIRGWETDARHPLVMSFLSSSRVIVGSADLTGTLVERRLSSFLDEGIPTVAIGTRRPRTNESPDSASLDVALIARLITRGILELSASGALRG